MGPSYNYIALYYTTFDTSGTVDSVIEVERRLGTRSALEDNPKVNATIKFKFTCYF